MLPPKAPSPNTIPLWARASTYEFLRSHKIHSTKKIINTNLYNDCLLKMIILCLYHVLGFHFCCLHRTSQEGHLKLNLCLFLLSYISQHCFFLLSSTEILYLPGNLYLHSYLYWNSAFKSAVNLKGNLQRGGTSLCKMDSHPAKEDWFSLLIFDFVFIWQLGDLLPLVCVCVCVCVFVCVCGLFYFPNMEFTSSMVKL